MPLSISLANRLGFIILGLTNNFAYVIMLSAAYDLIRKSGTPPAPPVEISSNVTAIPPNNNNNNNNNNQSSYCSHHSTSTILLADTIPSLTVKILYPFLFVGLPVAYKASATALLTAMAFLMTGLSSSQILIYSGVACASFSSGLGESTYLSNSPLYGDVALSGWSMGTGAAGLVGALAYFLLKIVLEIEWIMIIMLVIPISMLYAYFCMIKQVESEEVISNSSALGGDLSVISRARAGTSDAQDDKPINESTTQHKSYGANCLDQRSPSIESNQLDTSTKIRFLPSLAKYFFPLLLVYFAEYFINQGLFELVYYPEISLLDHPAQYRWFQVTYQFGVMLSRSSLDLFRIKYLWAMSTLQAVNAVLFLAHVAKLIHIPSFYIVVALIVYEGLLGGFTYANAFYRMKKELPSRMHEFAISTVTIADTLGIVIAGVVAMQAYNALCALYT